MVLAPDETGYGRLAYGEDDRNALQTYWYLEINIDKVMPHTKTEHVGDEI
ncbi:hypothetical protein GCM10008020_27230 [Massilia psychrophila]|nr:hypothetical protein GCM10008020_27230 [Massilia psychrophila]